MSNKASTYTWKKIYGIEFLYAGPSFVPHWFRADEKLQVGKYTASANLKVLGQGHRGKLLDGLRGVVICGPKKR